MKKEYCTQNQGDCWTCSLTNYGLDCANNPVSTARPKGNKRSRALQHYNGHKGPATVEHVERNITAAYPTAYAELTGVQYGKLMSVANTSYQDGKHSQGGLALCDDCVWLPWGGGIKTVCGPCQTDDPARCKCVDKIGTEQGQLVPIAALRQIKIIKEGDKTRYIMDFTE